MREFEDPKLTRLIGGHYSFVSQYMFIDLPAQFLQRLEGNTDFDDAADTLLYSRIYHEFTHFIQNVTTTYGIAKTVLFRAAGACFTRGLVSMRQSNIAINPPISDMIPRGQYFPYTHPLSPFALGHGLHGVIDGLENQNAFPAEWSLDGFTKPKTTTNAFVTYSGNTHAITAGTLMEYQAYSQQILALDNIKSIPKSHADELVSRLRTNINVRLVWSTLAFAFGVPAMSLELHRVAYELVTLALNPKWPVEPLQALSPHYASQRAEADKLPWEELHPGWRFLRAVLRIKEKSAPLPKIEEVMQFVEALGAELGWMPPSRALADTFTKIEDNESMADFKNIAPNVEELIGSNHESFWWVAKAMAQREELGCRGPLPSRATPERKILLDDASTQLFYARDFFCPECISVVHETDCFVASFLRSIGI